MTHTAKPSRRKRYIKLPAKQRKVLSIVLAGYALLIINSLVLLVFQSSTAFAYMTNVLLHVVLGTVLVVPVVAFLILHLMKMPFALNKAATLVGIVTAFSLSSLLVSGFLIVIHGAAAAGGWVLNVHIAAAIITVVGFVGHVSLKHGVRYHFLEWKDAWTRGPATALKHPFGMTLFAGLVVSLIALTPFAKNDSVYTEDGFDLGLASSQSLLAHDGFLDAEDLSRSETCGQAGCHPDVYAQWSESMHKFSSFNNPYYARAVNYMIERSGEAPTRWCASCHDPLVLFTGGFGNESPVDTSHWTAMEGLTCLSCHAITGLRDIKGNGRFVIAKPDEYPLARSTTSPGKEIHYKLLQIKPEPHRDAMIAPVHLTEAFCSTCHKVSVPPDVNNYRWKRGQNEWDDWHASGASGNTVRSFYIPAQPKTCIDCHMPLVPSTDRGNDGGMIRSHNFAAANSAVPFINGHETQLQSVMANLTDSIATVDIFRVRVGGKTYAADDPMPVLQPGQEVVVDVVVRNRKVGHKLPGGTNDSNELWLELIARNDAGETVLASGTMDDSHRVDTTAHFWGAVLVDRASQAIDKRNPQDWIANTYVHVINPGSAQTVHYRFVVPRGGSISSLEANLKHRKFKWYYNNWVHRGYIPEGQPDSLVSPDVDRRKWAFNDNEAPVLPVAVLASARRDAGKSPENRIRLWERWNDLGIGFLDEGDTRSAIQAFAKVSELAPTSAEGPINMARAYLSEGQLDKAGEVLDEAERRQPNYLKTAYFRGLYNRAFGEYDKTLADWMRVYERYPQDRVLVLGIGRVHFLAGRYEESLVWFDRVLEIDPEGLGGLYNRMLALGALNRTKEFEAAQELYEYYKDDEAAMALTLEYKQANPTDNRESQPIHDHGMIAP